MKKFEKYGNEEELESFANFSKQHDNEVGDKSDQLQKRAKRHFEKLEHPSESQRFLE